VVRIDPLLADCDSSFNEANLGPLTEATEEPRMGQHAVADEPDTLLAMRLGASDASLFGNVSRTMARNGIAAVFWPVRCDTFFFQNNIPYHCVSESMTSTAIGYEYTFQFVLFVVSIPKNCY
jgi:hypothetical protein